MNSNLHTLVLNTQGRPHRVTSWKKAVCMQLKDKIDVLEEYDVHVPTLGVRITIPAVVSLKRNVPFIKIGASFSRINVFTRDKFRCCYCNKRKTAKHLNYDHVLPQSRGGKTVWENIVTSCYDCNKKKGNRTPDEAGMKMHFKPYRPKVLPLTPFFFESSVPDIWKPYLGAVLQATG
jgi:hypothetical protein